MKKLIFIFALLCGSAFGSTVYVAQSAGTFSGGSACNGQTAVAAPYTVTSASATVYVCGTISSSTAGAGPKITVGSSGSGTSGSPTEIIFDTGASITNSAYWSSSSSGGAINLAGASWVIVDGGTPCGWNVATNTSEGTCNGYIQNTGNGDSLTYQQQSKGIWAAGCNNCEIRNLGIYNIYVHVQNGSFNNQDGTSCIWFSGTNFKIHDSDFHDAGFCLESNYTNDTAYSIYNNQIYDIDHGAAIAGAAFTLPTLYFYGNYVHDFYNWDCPSDGCHHDGLHVYNGSGGGVTSAYIYNNIMVPGSGGMGTTMNALLFLEGTSEGTPWTQSGTMYVFNNILITQGSHSAVQLNIGTSNLLANNTWGSTDDVTGDQCFIYQNGGGTGSFSLQANNGMYKCGQFESANGTMTFTGTISAQCDYNVYANSPGNGSGIWNWTTAGVTTSTFSTWQTSGCDTHGSYTPTGDLTLNSNYVPQTGSVLIGAGNNLYSTFGCSSPVIPGLGAGCSDAAGNTRPSTGAWTAGAYNASGGPPLPPTGLTATVSP